jgi:hypothetical protein
MVDISLIFPALHMKELRSAGEKWFIQDWYILKLLMERGVILWPLNLDAFVYNSHMSIQVLLLGYISC